MEKAKWDEQLKSALHRSRKYKIHLYLMHNIEKILMLHRSGLSHAKIAVMWRVTQPTISRLVRNEIKAQMGSRRGDEVSRIGHGDAQGF
jgi:predicted XRE-type DNA-binding protein